MKRRASCSPLPGSLHGKEKSTTTRGRRPGRDLALAHALGLGRNGAPAAAAAAAAALATAAALAASHKPHRVRRRVRGIARPRSPPPALLGPWSYRLAGLRRIEGKDSPRPQPMKTPRYVTARKSSDSSNFAAWFLPHPPISSCSWITPSERMTLRTLLHLLAFAAVASALLPTARPYTTLIRAFRAGQPLLAEPAAQAQGVDECIVEAENAVELSACADTSTPSSAPTASAGTAESGVAISEESKRSALMGAASRCRSVYPKLRAVPRSKSARWTTTNWCPGPAIRATRHDQGGADRSCGRLLPRTSSEAESTCMADITPNPPHALVRQQRNPLIRLWPGLSNFADRPVVMCIG